MKPPPFGVPIEPIGRRVEVSRCYDGDQVCPFFSFGRVPNREELPPAQCGAVITGYLSWIPADPVVIEPHRYCPLREGSITVVRRKS